MYNLFYQYTTKSLVISTNQLVTSITCQFNNNYAFSYHTAVLSCWKVNQFVILCSQCLSKLIVDRMSVIM